MPLPWTDDELKELVGHILYELEQLRRAAAAVGVEREAQEISWLIEEAGLVHARNLLNFFTTSKRYRDSNRPDDVIAADYTPDWEPRRTPTILTMCNVDPRAFRAGLNGRVMHLGRTRINSAPLDLGLAASAIDALCRRFHDSLDGNWKRLFEPMQAVVH